MAKIPDGQSKKYSVVCDAATQRLLRAVAEKLRLRNNMSYVMRFCVRNVAERHGLAQKEHMRE